MADMSSEAFFLTDVAGHFRYVNRRALKLGGWTWDELQQMTIADVNPDIPLNLYRHAVATLPPGPGMVLPVRARHKDGTFFPTEVSFARLDIAGEILVFGVARDITERAQMEASQRHFGQRMLELLDAERRRLARELHENVGQTVAAIDTLLDTLEQTPGAVASDMQSTLAATHATVRQITESVARLVHHTHPAELLGRGLEPALRTHAQEFAHRHGLALRLATVPLGNTLSAEHELHLYRIMQEALTNVARHAGATQVAIHLARRRRHVVLTIVDNGSGFASATPRPGGLGLITMRERVEMMGGEIRVRAGRGRGTTIHVTLPIHLE